MTLLSQKRLWLLVAILMVTVLVAAGTGAYFITPWKIPSILWQRGEGYAVLVHVRLPRVVLACCVGAILAMAGASLQGLFRNPLADPGLLGVNAGAGFGAALWIVLVGSSFLGVWGTSLAAFVGAWCVTWLAWRLAQAEGRMLVATLLLAGIALNSFAGAGIGLMTYLADDQQLRNLTFWLLGGLGGSTWTLVFVVGVCGSLGMLLQLRQARALDLMTLGESDAYHMGVATEPLKQQVVLGVTLSVAVGIAASGGIGFVGLVVPHLLRLWGGANHRYLLAASALGGAILLVLADLLARVVVAPAEIPVGIVTSLLGAPFLTWLLLRSKREALYA
ncbi:MAG: iron ABC transporter permease [Deltaproteobacteria bacterium]|nr:MAG: iron ABC transporter permease [Deltaproteobacteria bacterium]